MINMTNKHDNSNTANSNNYAPSSNKSDKVIENAEDLEMGGEEKEVDNTQVKNIGMTDHMVFLFFENAYNTMNTSEQTDSLKCPKCHIKYHVISEFHKLIKT